MPIASVNSWTKTPRFSYWRLRFRFSFCVCCFRIFATYLKTYSGKSHYRRRHHNHQLSAMGVDSSPSSPSNSWFEAYKQQQWRSARSFRFRNGHSLPSFFRWSTIPPLSIPISASRI